jgi:predicted phosphohydrolase
MRLFAIGDTHLPSTRGKTMDRFGWAGHPGPLAEAWDRMVTPDDGVIVAGDISWATKPAEVTDDLAWLEARPGKKVLLRGNHDFWWGDSAAKLRRLLEPYRSIAGFLQSSAVTLGPYLIAGSRLWTTPEAPPMPGGEMGDEQADGEFVAREARRLALSIEDAGKRIHSTPGSPGWSRCTFRRSTRTGDRQCSPPSSRRSSRSSASMATSMAPRASPRASRASTEGSATCWPPATPRASSRCCSSTVPEARLPSPALPSRAALP